MNDYLMYVMRNEILNDEYPQRPTNSTFDILSVRTSNT